jgi:gamma-glutamyltranspeptidase/glutathione hydrolase
MSDLDFRFASRRAPVYARHGVVAASQPLAAQAGLEVLRAGGNAADGAVATAAALAVVEPTGTGVGGDCFALFFHAATKQVHAVNGSGRSPAALDLERLEHEGLRGTLPRHHVHNVTVPGTVRGWADTLERHGSMPLADVLQGAIALAEEGAPISPIIAYLWDIEAEKVAAASPNGGELLIDGHAPRAGEVWTNPGLASVLREVAEGGPGAFYEGRAARAIVEVVGQLGGVMALEDLAAHHSTFDPPISTSYRGHTIFECPPNGQGLAALLALGVAERFDIGALPRGSTERLHLLIEAVRLGFGDARAHVADLAHSDVPVERLLSDDHANGLAARFDPAARIDVTPGVELAVGSDTVYLSVVDGAGNACSFINSNYNGTGTGIVPRGCGFPLQNRGAGFSHEEGHPNALAPRKRPYHTIIPAMSTDPSGDLHACYGVMGGWMQPQGHLQVTVAMLDDGLDPQQALDELRFCISTDPPNGTVMLEEGLPAATIRGLQQRGHPVEVVTGTRRPSVFGKGQIIVRDPRTGVLTAGSDPRADGVAAAY